MYGKLWKSSADGMLPGSVTKMGISGLLPKDTSPNFVPIALIGISKMLAHSLICSIKRLSLLSFSFVKRWKSSADGISYITT